MHIITPTSIEQAAWEGELTPLPGTFAGSGAKARVSIGQPVWWKAAEALSSAPGQPWTPPAGERAYALARLACTLHPLSGDRDRYTEAALTVYLRPRQGSGTAHAHDLLPTRRTVEQKGKFTVGLTPELKFAEAIDVKLLSASAEIELHQAFPVIQAFGLGEARAEWRFEHHRSEPLIGSQFVYVVIAAPREAGGVRATIELSATVETRFGPVRLAAPESSSSHVSCVIEY